jgi:hypothetical protein
MNNELAFPANKYNGGMTLRDYFAAKAMQAMALDSTEDFTDIAERAYILADAMLEARK